MIGGVTRQGEKLGLLDRPTLSSGVKSCHVFKVGNPPNRGPIRDTSNLRKIYFGGGFA